MGTMTQISSLLFDNALHPNWVRAHLGCDSAYGVVSFRELAFYSSLEISQNGGRVGLVVMSKLCDLDWS